MKFKFTAIQFARKVVTAKKQLIKCKRYTVKFELDNRKKKQKTKAQKTASTKRIF